MNYKRLVASFLMGATLVSGVSMPVIFADTNTYASTFVEINHSSSHVNMDGIKAFVTRMYRVCLDREPEEDGLNGWAQKLANKEATGCSVAYGFVFSPEFIGKNPTNEAFVNYMYDAFFGREADEGGFKYWVDLLNNGATKESVFCGFANSEEFSNLCNNYGVVRGFHIEGEDFNRIAMVNLFVERLYNVVLNRTCDEVGMSGWSVKLNSHEETGCSVAYGFVFSPEFLNKDKSNSDYVEILYNAFLGRSSDADGKASWVSMLNEGYSREYVFNGFAGSLEFAVICQAYGIEPGKLPEVPATTPNPTTNPTTTPTVSPTATPTGSGSSNTTTPANTPATTPAGNSGSTTTPTGSPTSNPGSNPTSTPTSNPGANSTVTPTAAPTLPSSQQTFKDVVYDGQYQEFDSLPSDTSKIDGLVYVDTDYSWKYDTYYFDNGQRLSGWVNVYEEADGQKYLYGKYYFDPATGKAVTNWNVIDGVEYYFHSDGDLARGVTSINSDLYWFNDNGIKLTGFNNDFYFDPATGKAVTGWQTINNNTYYFYSTYDNEFKMAKGKVEINNKWYYFDNSGALQTGWITLDGKEYYAGNDGILKFGPTTIDGKVYLLTNDGLGTGFYGQEYYFDPSTKVAVKGLQRIDGKLYYFNDSGIMQKGIVNVNGTLYYVDFLGTVRNGMCSIDGNKTYFICVNNIVQTGVIKYNNNIYIANSSGTLQSGWQTVNGDKYYIDGFSYQACTGFTVVGGTVYIFDTNTAKLCKGWTTQNGTRYYCNDNGVPVTGLQTIGGRKYYFDNNGEQKTGLITIGGSTYYFNDDMKYGWISLGNYMYYANTSTGALYKNSLQQINGKTYYFSFSGFLLTGEQQINSSYYFFGNDGAMLTGWQYVRSGYHYYNSDGRRQGPGWFTIGSTYYYLDSNSYRLTGWIQGNDGYWYYCDEDKAGAMITNGWKYSNSHWYYFDGTGAMQTEWINDNGTYYYMNPDPEDGYMWTNTWIEGKDGYWYYVTDNGSMAVNTSMVIDGKTYYFDSQGRGPHV